MQKLTLAKLVAYRHHAIASKSLSRKLGITLPFVAYALDAGESISAEESTLTRLFQVTDGVLTVAYGDQADTVAAGELLVVPAHTLHTLRATQPCQFIQFETEAR